MVKMGGVSGFGAHLGWMAPFRDVMHFTSSQKLIERLCAERGNIQPNVVNELHFVFAIVVVVTTQALRQCVLRTIDQDHKTRLDSSLPPSLLMYTL